MKALIISLGLLLIVSTGFSQLVEKNVLKGSYKIFQPDNEEPKHLKYNVKEQTLNIFNIEHSIWKTVRLPMAKGHFLDEVKLISTNIFNDDNLVEILYTCLNYNYSYDFEDPETSDSFLTFTLNIINEKGEILLQEESKDYEIIDSPGVNYLYVYKNITKGFSTKPQTIIYSFLQ